jgi:4-hydroxy-2-oxoheptanedioate aldolase
MCPKSLLARASNFGRIRDYVKAAHEELCVLVQVETREALEHLDAISRCAMSLAE